MKDLRYGNSQPPQGRSNRPWVWTIMPLVVMGIFYVAASVGKNHASLGLGIVFVGIVVGAIILVRSGFGWIVQLVVRMVVRR